jgi:hypothetical protein
MTETIGTGILPHSIVHLTIPATKVVEVNVRSTTLTRIRAEDEARTRYPQLGRLMLYQMSYFRLFRSPFPEYSPSRIDGSIYRPLFQRTWWGEKDSNLRTPKRTDLQSVAVGHLAISPVSFRQYPARRRTRSSLGLTRNLFEPMEGFEPPTY